MQSLKTTAADTLLAAGDNPLLPNWWEVLVTAIAFLILLFIVKKKVVPMFEETYTERVAKIEGGLQQAENAAREIQQKQADLDAQMKAAHHEANRIREEARAEGAEILKELREKAQEESARITHTAHVQIQAERENAVRSLRTEVGGLATELAERIVGESLKDDARSGRVVDRFLEELESEGSTAAKAAR